MGVSEAFFQSRGYRGECSTDSQRAENCAIQSLFIIFLLNKIIAIEKNLAIIFRGYPLLMIWTPRQSISLVQGTRFVDDKEAKAGEFEGPTGLAPSKKLFFEEVFKVFMISPNSKFVAGAFKVMPPSNEGADDSKEFEVMDRIIGFRGIERLGDVGNRVPTVKLIGLFKDGAKGKLGSVRDDAEWFRVIREC